MDYGFRNYDPQIGRFVQTDPLTDETPALSSYHYALNDPITNIDEDGLIGIPCPGASMVSIFIERTGEVLRSISNITSIFSIGTHLAQIGDNYANSKTQGKKTENLLNGKNVQQVGGQKATGDNSNDPPWGSVKSYTPGFLERWQKSASFFGQASYSVVDDIYVSLQLFRDKSYKQHLGGGHVNNNQAQRSFINSATLFVPFGGAEAKAVQGVEKAIVIGEGMDRVKIAAKSVAAKWYQAWSKNFPTNRLMTPAELSAAQARNARWLNSKINQGYKIYDIGIDATRATRSPFYQLERSILQQRGYPTTVIPR